MARHKEKGVRSMQEFQQKKRAEELAMVMVARNKSLEELDFKVKEEEIILEAAERHAKFLG